MTQSSQRSTVEYSEAGANLRHYSNLRFAQLTIFMAAVGGLISFSLRTGAGLPDARRVGIAVVGVIVTVAFWIMEERIIRYWEHHRSNAVRLEEALGFQQYRGRPHSSFVSGRAAARLLIITSGLWWVVDAISAIMVG